MSIDPSSAPSIAARDLIGALISVTGKVWRYRATGTAGGDDGSVTTTVVATGADGSQYRFVVTIGHEVL